jgi:hypothetical protein
MKRECFDFLIIGGGIFGVYSALYLAEKGLNICLIEKESALMQKASIVNQARLHAGYHYPRSIGTARIADEHKDRFTNEHKVFINFKFEQYYGIDKYGSFTDSKQFERFCETLRIKAEPVKEHPFINFQRIQELYLTEEYSFDPILIAEYYKSKVKSFQNVTIKMNSKVVTAYQNNNNWIAKIKDDSANESEIEAPAVINATYCGTNTINRIFSIHNIKLMHEITEMAMIHSKQFKNIGLTIMDGHFASLMPYGLSNLLSLSSVTYTHHKVSYEDEPIFDCQRLVTNCRPDSISVCNTCPLKPPTSKNKMIQQMRQYLNDNVDLNYFFSMYTIKTKLQASYIDDGRPTEIAMLNSKPDYYCLFAGKINSIYEIEKFIQL